MNDKSMAESTPTGRPRFGPSSFLPDPNKWIQTGSATRKPLQRPLVGFKHGFATPPSTVKRTPTPAGRTRRDTPNAPAAGPSKLKVLQDRQSTLSGFLTPPKTESIKKKRQKISRDEKDNAVQREQVRGERATDRGRKDQQLIASSPEHHPSVEYFPPLSQNRRGDLLHGGSARHLKTQQRSSSPYQAHSSDVPITPIPDDVLQKHSRLCGQDPGYLDAIPSPWTTKEERERKTAKIRANDGGEKSLRRQKANGAGVIRELAVNVARNSVRDPGDATVDRSKLQNSARQDMPIASTFTHAPIARPSTPSRPSPMKGRNVIRSPLPRTSDTPEKGHGPKIEPHAETHKAHRSSSVEPSIPTSPLCNMRNTPQKDRSPHHRVTPPKSKPSGKRRDAAASFVLPEPPAQPVFKTSPNTVRRAKNFEPVDQAETLMTWSLGARRLDPPHVSPTNDVRPALAPIQRSSSTSIPSRPASSSQSIPGSELSQPFPALLPSPPCRIVSPLATSTESVSPPSAPSRVLVDASTQLPPVKNLESPMATPTAGASRWDRLQRGILSVPIDPITPLSFANKTTQDVTARKANAARRSDGLTQATLAAYGATKTKVARKTKRPFELAFEDEDELEFSSDPTAQHLNSLPCRSNGRKLDLCSVPAAPPDPRLRPSAVKWTQAAACRPKESPPETALLERLASATQQTESVPEYEREGLDTIHRQPVMLPDQLDLPSSSPDGPGTSSTGDDTSLSTSSGVVATESMWAFRNALSSGSERP